MELTEREKELIETFFDSWIVDGYPLPAKLSYQDVFDFCDKFGIEKPLSLVSLLERYEKEAEQWRQSQSTS